MPDRFGVLAVTNSRTFYLVREAAGVPNTRHSLRPLSFMGQRFDQNPGRLCRGNTRARVELRIASLCSLFAAAEVVNCPAFPRNSGTCRLIVVYRCYRDSMQAGRRFEAPAQGRRVRGSTAGLVRHGSVMGLC